jgi:hypothetical protein
MKKEKPMSGEVIIHNKYQPLSAKEVKDQIIRIQDILRNVMIEGVHYGVVQGTKEKTLLKAGSELLLTTFRVAARPIIEDLSTDTMVRYRITTEGIHIGTGRIVGYGVGECSSAEEKYAWREAVCQEEFDATDEKDRRVKWKWKWGQVQGQKEFWSVDQVRTNPLDQANTILKMCQKRSKSDLVLTAFAASDVFVQDMDEIVEQVGGQPAPHPKAQSAAPKTNGREKSQGGGKKQQVDMSNAPIQANQVAMIRNKLENAGIDEKTLLMHFDIEMVDSLMFVQFNEVMEWIKETYQNKVRKDREQEPNQ